MNNCIPVILHHVNRNQYFLADIFKSLKACRTSMVLFSKGCYDHIKNSCIFLGNTEYPHSSKQFMQHNMISNTRYYFSLTPLYSGQWYFFENLNCYKTKYTTMYKYHNDDIPKEIIFVLYDDEKVDTNIVTSVITSSKEQSPIDYIMNNSDEQNNAMIFLQKSAFDKLALSAIKSYHNGVHSLSWNYDVSYAGGNAVFRVLSDESLYSIEQMKFSYFSKEFVIDKLPNAIFFIN